MLDTVVPDRFDTEPIIAWRLWRVKRCAPGVLHSPVMLTMRWKPRETYEACCRYSIVSKMLGPDNTLMDVPHFAPQPHCGCGVHGVKIMRKLAMSAGSAPHLLTILGRVSLWGMVIETTGGYRAQYGYPYDMQLLPPARQVCDQDELQRVAHSLATAYGVEVTVPDRNPLVL